MGETLARANRLYYAAHKEQILARKRVYWEKNKEKLKQKVQETRAIKRAKNALTPEEQKQRNIELTSLWWGRRSYD